MYKMCFWDKHYSQIYTAHEQKQFLRRMFEMSVSIDVQQVESSSPTAHYDAVVLGAGPYGLSAATHLRSRGLKVAVFGKPIQLWREHMPEGMYLRSYWWATNLSDPQKKYSFEHYFQEKGIDLATVPDPITLEMFVDYALWFQKNAVPDLDETYIAHIERKDNQFLVTLEDGRVVSCNSVVMAPGLHYYRHVPEEYKELPSTLVSHSSDHNKLGRFEGKRVAIIGRGQAALELAALAREAGAEVQLISRSPFRWVKVASGKLPPWLQSIRSPKAMMGSGWSNLLLEKYPYVFHRTSQSRKDTMVDTTHGPAGSHWLKPRLIGKVTMRENVSVKQVEAVDDIAQITLSDGEVVQVDHIILGTGFHPDVKRLHMLDTTLADAVQTYKGSPVLNTWFESNVPGLYFIGYSAVRSFGPYYRFVTGVEASAKRVAHAVARSLATHSR
jgi:cation diffusion facilitator CzcD-associated flavoprotein CzcO